MSAIIRFPLPQIGGTPGQGCMGRPGQICAPLTGEQMASLADITKEIGVPIQVVAGKLLGEAIERYARNTVQPTHETGDQ